MSMPSSISFQTVVPNPHYDWRISHDGGVLLVGSCFTENIGARLVDSGFACLVNPFGILYNPISMAEALRRCLNREFVGEEHLVNHNGLWHSWLHHGSFSSDSKEGCLQKCNESIAAAHRFLFEECETVVLTLGSAYLYELLDSSFSPSVVGNCHKVPAARFEKRRVSEDEIVAAWEPIWVMLRSLPRNPKVLFTVSPIRHWADGAHGNQLSKSTLLLAVEKMMGEGRDYFPAYEIVMDELRDYRFYADDLLHPSRLAEGVIWGRLQYCLMDSATIELSEKYQRLHRLQAHRPMNRNGEEFEKYEQRLRALQHELLGN